MHRSKILCIFVVVEYQIMHLFLATIENNRAILNESESTHCAKVLRLSEGNQILVSDGRGTLCEAELTVVNPKSCEAEILREMPVLKRSYHLHVACAPTKNIDRFEWFLEKATEIGIDEITPILTAHSERTVVKTERCERVIMAAMKQCQVPNLPAIHEMKKFPDFLKTCNADRKFICYCGNEFEKRTLKNALSKGISEDSSILILIGPEGDFSPNEVALAVEQNFIPVSLGSTRLRTETAGIVAVQAVSFALQP